MKYFQRRCWAYLAPHAFDLAACGGRIAERRADGDMKLSTTLEILTIPIRPSPGKRFENSAQLVTNGDEKYQYVGIGLAQASQ